MRQACVPKVETKGLWLATLGLGMTSGLLTFCYLNFVPWRNDFGGAVLAIVIACGLGAAWGTLLTMTLERVATSVLQLGLVALLVTLSTAYALTLGADDGLAWIWTFRGTAAYYSVLLSGFYIGIITFLIWGAGTIVSLLPRWILGRPRVWTPAMCPRCLYDIGDERIEVCPECGALRDVAFARRNWSAQGLRFFQRRRRWLFAIPAVIFAIWTSQQVVTHTIPQWRFHRAIRGERVTPWALFYIDMHDSKTAAIVKSGKFSHITSLRRSNGRYFLDVVTLSADDTSKLFPTNWQVPRTRVPVRVIATLSPVQTRRVMRNGELPAGMLAAMEDRWLEVYDGLSVVFDVSPFFDSD